MSYEPAVGEVVRAAGRSGKTYVGAFRKHLAHLTGWSTLTLTRGGSRPAGRVFVITSSIESIGSNEPLYCELCGEDIDVETGMFWDAIGNRNVVAHTQCGTDAGYALA